MMMCITYSQMVQKASHLILNRNLDAALKKLFTWLLWVLLAACGILSCGVWDLVP